MGELKRKTWEERQIKVIARKVKPLLIALPKEKDSYRFGDISALIEANCPNKKYSKLFLFQLLKP